MVEITKLLGLINDITGFKCILAFQGVKPPEKPYISTQVLNINQNKRRGSKKIIKDKELMVEYKVVNHVNVILQFDCIGNNILDCKEVALSVFDFFNSRYREYLWEKGYGVVKIGEIKDRTILKENTEYLHISTIEINIEYERISTYEIENLNKITSHSIEVERKQKED
ncbi:MAG: phage neck terminator protein [Cetobacterium sp.]